MERRGKFSLVFAAALAASGWLLVGGSGAQTSSLGSNWYLGAPYAYEYDSAGPNLTQGMSATGVKVFDLAFILADGGTSCTPSWNGNDPVSSDTQVAGIISAVRSAGGDVGVSFGGYGGTKLGQVCGSAQATAAAEQQVVYQYSLKAVDFDLEEPEYENSTAIAYELGAAKILQQDNPGLIETVTLPGTTSGTGYYGQQLLDEAKSLGYTPNAFTIMPFDGGFSGASSQIAALQDFNTMLVNTFGWTSSYAYAHEGFSGMNGRTDSGEYFYQSDFQSVLTFAEQNGLGRYTFWDANRDRECNPPNNNGNLSSECSSVTQNAWDFTTYAVAFSQHTSSTSPTTTTTTAPTEGPYGGSAAAVPGTVQAANYDTGGHGVAYNVTSVNGTANSYRSDGVDLEACTDTGCGYDIGWTSAGQWFRYTVNVASAGTYTLSLRLASPNGVTDGLHIANASGTNLSGNINVPATGGWQAWTTVTASVSLPAGTQTLVVDQDNGGWNIHYLAFATAGTTNLATGATMTASGYNQTYVPANANDGNTSTYWESTNNAFPQWLEANLGSAKTVGAMTVDLPPSWSARTQTFSVLGSTDGSTWTTLVASANYTFDPSTGNTVSFSVPSTSAQYLRLNFTANTGWPAGQVSEWQIFS